MEEEKNQGENKAATCIENCAEWNILVETAMLRLSLEKKDEGGEDASRIH